MTAEELQRLMQLQGTAPKPSLEGADRLPWEITMDLNSPDINQHIAPKPLPEPDLSQQAQFPAVQHPIQMNPNGNPYTDVGAALTQNLQPKPGQFDWRPAGAAQLEADAMRPEPHRGGWGGLLNSAVHGMIGAQYPGGVLKYDEAQGDRAFRDQQAKLALAKQYREEALQQQNLDRQDTQERDRQNYQQAQIAEVRRQRDLEEERANRPTFKDFGTAGGGFLYGQIDPRTGKFSQQGTIPGVPPKSTNSLANAKSITVDYQGQPVDALMGVDPDDPTKFGHIFLPTPQGLKDITGEAKHRDTPAFQFLPGASGNIEAVGNAKSGQINPINNSTNARKAPVSAEANSKIADLENSARKIDELGKAYSPDFIGPYAGRYERSKASGVLSFVPGMTTPEGYGNFAALQADLKNAVIKMITGAQMGQQEAQRILQQVPTETDKPEIWEAKYAQTKKNAEFLMNEIRRLNGVGGGGVNMGQTQPPGGGPQIGEKRKFGDKIGVWDGKGWVGQ